LEYRSDEELASAAKRHITETRREFESLWTTLRPELGEIYQRHGAQRPRTLVEVIPHALSDTGLFWIVAKGLYERAKGGTAPDETIRHFVDVCPPYPCAVWGLVMTWYDRSLRDFDGGEKFHAGRNDLLMAIYLPYCDQFISAEVKKEQKRCLAEIVRLAGTHTVVRTYDEFCSGMLIVPAA